jgi:glycosyltransferase involved in cell wall biosynthesis
VPSLLPKVAIVHPRLSYGGSESKVVWSIEALKSRCQVTLITGGPVDLDLVNEYYGTKLMREDFSIIQAPLPPGLSRTAKFAALRGHLLQRYMQRVAPNFDVLISAYNPCDFGVRGIQFIADFSFLEHRRLMLHPSLQNYRHWWYGDSPLRRTYLRLCESISPGNRESWKRNVTIANSEWTAKILLEELGIPSRTIYPPVAEEFPAIPWAERENGFVCIGRVVPEKRMDAVIRILEKVRARGHDVHLHILGEVDDSPFGRKLKHLASMHREWVFLEGWTFGPRKRDLVAKHRFGINAQQNEPFGIAPAEMVKAGCITFVPDGGGQTEIVNHPALIYENHEAAAAKIERVLANTSLQNTLRDHLSQSSGRFSVDGFERSIRKIVIEFLQEKKIAREANH